MASSAQPLPDRILSRADEKNATEPLPLDMIDLPVPAESREDPISRVRFSPHQQNASQLLVSTWSKHLHLYDTAQPPESSLVNTIQQRAVILDCVWSPSPNIAYTASADWDVRRLDLASGGLSVISSHSHAAAYLACSLESNVLISASWDKTLHIHPIDADGNTTGQHSIISLPAKPTSLALAGTRLVVGLVGRQIYVYDVPALAIFARQSEGGEVNFEPMQRRESSLKFATRSLLARPDDSGFVAGSIEGRVAVEWYDPSDESQAKKYAFKCHRQPLENEEGDLVFPVHALAWHPNYDTFATGGGDGVVALWDAAAKRRIKQYPKFNGGVLALSFSADGRRLAVGISPQYEDGMDVEKDFPSGPVRVVIRELAEGEAKGKGAK